MKKRILATALSLAVGLTAAVGLSACSKPENPIVVGYTVYAPMNYKENGKLVGFDTEFAEMALEELGYTPVFQIIDWDNKVFELQTNQIDLIWNGMTITDELKENIAITDSYMKNKQVVVTKSANAAKFTDIASLSAAASIAVESGSAGEEVATDNNYANKLNKMAAQSDCLLEVKTARSEIAIMAEVMTGAGTDYADLTFIDVGFAEEEYGIGLRKEDTELLAALNAIIARYKQDGTFDTLIEKYWS